MTYARIIGTGSFVPNEPVSNAMLVERLAKQGIETSDEWIRERTGITQRYWANPDQTTSSLAEVAAKNALEMAGVHAEELDLIIVGTSTGDMMFPSSACLLQSRIGAKKAAAFDVQAACTGFIYALTTANAMIRSGQIKTALVVGAEVISRLLDWSDRTTCVLFGDGAGAVVLQASDEPGVLSCKVHADGDLSTILYSNGVIKNGQIVGHPFITMDGQAVFKNAVKALGDVAIEVLEDARMDVADLDWFIPHQANIRIMQAAAKRLNVPDEKVIVSVNLHGNTSAASVPLALDKAVRDGRIQKGQTLLLQGVGGGFTWGASLLKF
ncbi:beta-ketoacyl-ACP synthase III [Hydromonas duriensis]|uniref:Beta-ketoacyl-[acyl-carrier-protein] synthase III n=1 Tax=Hydromonas duriensis TaxID=1527608 RepID=A0A4R6Y3K0_9BURK|nr:beta-ketoacyl-ACP synthase III [Hydromonas duriensis]TDR31090.1 3-oxoacyl-[acyl-carrier-protein] synthase III [Hydromonas duriensis]